MEAHELFARRRQAREQKRLHDLKVLEEHRQIVDLLFRGDDLSQKIRAEALATIDIWERKEICSPYYVHEWREWLNWPEKYARAAILREDDIGLSMRCNSPFGRALARLKAQAEQAAGSQK
jgi:hypothetical protein